MMTDERFKQLYHYAFSCGAGFQYNEAQEAMTEIKLLREKLKKEGLTNEVE